MSYLWTTFERIASYLVNTGNVVVVVMMMMIEDVECSLCQTILQEFYTHQYFTIILWGPVIIIFNKLWLAAREIKMTCPRSSSKWKVEINLRSSCSYSVWMWGTPADYSSKSYHICSYNKLSSPGWWLPLTKTLKFKNHQQRRPSFYTCMLINKLYNNVIGSYYTRIPVV